MPASFTLCVVLVDPGISQNLVKNVQQGLLQELVNVFFIDGSVLCLQLFSPWQIGFQRFGCPGQAGIS